MPKKKKQKFTPRDWDETTFDSIFNVGLHQGISKKIAILKKESENPYARFLLDVQKFSELWGQKKVFREDAFTLESLNIEPNPKHYWLTEEAAECVRSIREFMDLYDNHTICSINETFRLLQLARFRIMELDFPEYYPR